MFGCADLKVPLNGWYKREGDVATVGCETQDLRWSLKCEDNQWTGVVGNCSAKSMFAFELCIKMFSNVL